MANAPEMRLLTPAMSSWSRLIRSSDSAGMTLNRLDMRVREERLDARPQQAGPGDGLVAIVSTSCQLWRFAYSRHSRNWSSIEASRWMSAPGVCRRMALVCRVIEK